MKRVLIIVSFSLLLFSCSKEKVRGGGSVITENRNLANFTGITVFGSSAVQITQGSSFRVEVRGYGNLLPYYETRIVNNNLEMGYKNNVNVKNDNIQVLITMPALNSISLHGSGNISTTGIFAGNTNFNAFIAGSGNINFSSGSTQNFNSSIEGSGNIYTLNMVTDNAETHISGSGNTEITANNQLKVTIAGSGNVYYRGTPVITTFISGSGAVIPK
jgi:hypothetical protein